MISASVLSKMRMGVGAAWIALSTGYSGCGLAADQADKTPPEKEPKNEKDESAELTSAQLIALRKSIPQLEADDFNVRQSAFEKILALGKGATPHLRKALENATGSELKSSLNRLIVTLNPKRAQKHGKEIECGPCGKG